VADEIEHGMGEGDELGVEDGGRVLAGPAEEILRFGEVTMAVRASAEATGGAISLLEELPPLADTPPHVHANEDEYFHILEGEHLITVGDEEHRLAPGQGIFAPRGVPHAQKRVDPGVGRLLVVCSPGGLEGFFRRLASAEAEGTLGPDAYASASEEFGITWL
jgi:mannose-6-phosphate isomerase-like protein (cupin superfamily)